mgnify:FL=1
MELIVVSILVIGLAIWWRMDRKVPFKAISEKIKQHHPYAAVQLLPCVNACDSAHRVSKNTYLTTEFQHLPIDDCDRIEDCDCKFKHIDDRRLQEDRRSFNYIMQDIFHAEEHRNMKKMGRRRTDGFLQYE